MKWDEATLRMEMQEVIDMMEHIRREQSTLNLSAKELMKQAQIRNKARMELSRQMSKVITRMQELTKEAE
jgi:thiamine biosynthesis lipoprotein ApbE